MYVSIGLVETWRHAAVRIHLRLETRDSRLLRGAPIPAPVQVTTMIHLMGTKQMQELAWVSFGKRLWFA